MLSSAVEVQCCTKVSGIVLSWLNETFFTGCSYTKVPAIYLIVLGRNRVVRCRAVGKLPHFWRPMVETQYINKIYLLDANNLEKINNKKEHII